MPRPPPARRFGATNDEGEQEYQQVQQEQMIEACGDTARYLKPYQMVGAGWLLGKLAGSWQEAGGQLACLVSPCSARSDPLVR